MKEPAKDHMQSLCERLMPKASPEHIAGAAENMRGIISSLRQIARHRIEEDKNKAEAEGDREYVWVPWEQRLCPDCGHPNSEHIFDDEPPRQN